MHSRMHGSYGGVGGRASTRTAVPRNGPLWGLRVGRPDPKTSQPSRGGKWFGALRSRSLGNWSLNRPVQTDNLLNLKLAQFRLVCVGPIVGTLKSMKRSRPRSRDLAEFIEAIVAEPQKARYWAEHCSWVPGTGECAAGTACSPDCWFLSRREHERAKLQGRLPRK